jgi:hypothetical protein
MKRKLLYILMLGSLNIYGQQLINANLELWTTETYGVEPSNWTDALSVFGTNNYIAGFTEGDPLTTTKISGAQAAGGTGNSVLLETKSSVGNSMTSQGLITIPGLLSRESAINGIIGSINFKYKCTVVTGDSCFVSVKTVDASGSPCAEGIFWIKPNNNTSIWQTQSIVLQNISAQTPTKIIITSMSTFDEQYTYSTTIIGSKLYLDNFNLIYCSNPINTNTSITICDDALPYIWNGVTFNSAGIQLATLNSITGCDSIVSMTLNVIPGPYTLIPDIGFETKLGQLGLDPCGIDGKVPTSLIQNLTTLNLSGAFSPAINDLTGIQAFAALEGLYINRSSYQTTLGVYITSPSGFNLSQNLNLKNLQCTGCNLQQLDLSANTMLETLNIGSWTSPPTLPMNAIPNLNLSTNQNLSNLIANYCGIQNILLPATTSLITINTSHNNISSIDIANLTNLTDIDLSFNNVVYINGANNNLLSLLNLDYNPNLISLPISSQFVETLKLSNCGFSGLNLSNCINLKSLDCSNNNLGCLNLKNGANNQINYLKTTNNFTLTCIEVDDSVFSANNNIWSTNKDAWSSYSEDCQSATCFTAEITDVMPSLTSVFPNPASDYLIIDTKYLISNVVCIDMSGKRIELIEQNGQYNIGELQNGMYSLRVTFIDGAEIITKVIINK